MANEQQRRTAKNMYVDGSNVREMQPAPVRRRKPQPSQRPEREEQPKRQQIREQQRKQRIAKRNIEKAKRINLAYTAFLAVAVVVMLSSCIYYLSLMSTVQTQSRHITSLKSELNSLADENLAMAERISTIYDLQYIHDYATNELGMVYAKKSQIVYYTSSNSDYVKQHKSIPNN